MTGVIIDTFGNLRDERARRDSVLENECFVCGLTRVEYEQLGPEFNFNRHKEEVGGLVERGVSTSTSS